MSEDVATAFVLINAKPLHEGEVWRELEKIKEIESICRTETAYSFVVKMVCPDYRMKELIRWNICKMPFVYNTLTLLEVSDVSK